MAKNIKEVEHKGFKLTASRERCLGGWYMNYYSAYRIDDGYELISSFSDSADKLQVFIDEMKSTIDDYLINPQDYADERSLG